MRTLKANVLLLLALAAQICLAQTPDGDAIARRADLSDVGFQSSRVDVAMVIRDAKGRSRERKLELKTLERANHKVGDRTLIVFHEPLDVARTALLSHAKLLEDDHQWLYLPRMNRVKRISGANKRGSFVGSEFSFEDLTAQEVDKFTHRWLRSEEVDGIAMHVVERRPRYAKSGFAKQHVWFDQPDGQIRRIESFGRSGSLTKVLTLSDYRVYPGGFHRAHTMEMRNVLTEKSTTLSYSSYEFDIGLSEADFERSALQRI